MERGATMRKFLIEMDVEITLADVKKEYEARREEIEEDGAENFAQFLDLCMFWNNGALTEILTEETPRGEQARAVTLCRVWYSDDADDFCDEWLTEQEAHEKAAAWCGVMPLR